MHVSYSSYVEWSKCAYGYKLKYIDKIPYDKGTIHTAFGSSVHSSIQYIFEEKDNASLKSFFKETFANNIRNLPDKVKYDIFNDENNKALAKSMMSVGHVLSNEAVLEIKRKFEDFELIAIESEIMEPITGYNSPKKDYDFKGYIDLSLRTRGDGIYHVLDHKTTSWGWDARKKNNKLTTYQLTLYKHFFSQQYDIPYDKIKTYFNLIKRTAKKNRIEIFESEAGKIKIKNALNELNIMLYNIDKNNFPKNKLSCADCPFHRTKWCKC